jgi:protein SCO1
MTITHRQNRRDFIVGMSRGISAAAVRGLVPLATGGPSPGDTHGRVDPPVPVPEIAVIRHDGVATTLSALSAGHATALQVMFTACTTTCPIQGAIFARVQRLFPDQVAHGVQLLSVSVDPAHDDPRALASWLRRFHARPGWVAAAPGLADVERLRDFSGRGASASDNHATQVALLSRDARLVWRTSELPDAQEIVAALRKL